MKVTGKYVLVTGASMGIGYELAKLFAQDRYNLIIAARGGGELEKSAVELRQYSVDVIPVVADLFSSENAFNLYNTVKEMGIEIDILVNNAGQGLWGKFTETELLGELNIIQLNVSSLVVLTKLFLKDMVHRGSGKILNVASVASKTPGPYQSVYHGTKAFVHSFTEAIRSEMENENITITSLLPGATATDFFNKAGMQDAKIVREGKMADPADVAKDGYRALMEGKDMVVSGTMNKVQTIMTKILPDKVSAAQTKKQNEPVYAHAEDE